MRILALASLILCLLPRASWAQTVPPEASIAWGAATAPRVKAVTSATPHPSVARIIVPNRDGMAFGSGTLVDLREKHGLVLTNWHVVDGASDEITVRFPDGFVTGARVLKVDKVWDLAALAIWRPNCQPVKLAKIPPQPDDWLAIAGYGSGTYRFISGRCTQYFAPKTNYPLELVELSVAARQGDSGGPIFNQQGELAGVLFGASYGTTMGSYCGRVKQFLAGVLPPDGADDKTLIAARPTTTPPNVGQATGLTDATKDRGNPFSQASGLTYAPGLVNAPTAPSGSLPALQPLNANRVSQPEASPFHSDTPRQTPARFGAAVGTPSAPAGFSAPVATSATPAAAREPPPTSDEISISWEQIAGKTPLEQGKTILAAIGGLTMLVFAMRWMRT